MYNSNTKKKAIKTTKEKKRNAKYKMDIYEKRTCEATKIKLRKYRREKKRSLSRIV